MYKFVEKAVFVKNGEGKRTLGPLIYLMGALAVAAPLVLFFNMGGSPLFKQGQASEEGPSPFQTAESDRSQANDMSNTSLSEMEREIQIAEEQGSNLRGEELEQRKEAIREKYEERNDKDRNAAARIDFTDRLKDFVKPETQEAPAETPQDPEQPAKQGYMTFAERLAAQGNSDGGSSGSGSKILVFQQGSEAFKSDPSQTGNPNNPGEAGSTATEANSPANMLPLGTFIPVTLDQDVISTDLQATVWATVATDVTFRRQLQIPLGLAKLRGRTATQPVQNLLDIVFDVMVFSDGSELPIQGFAYSAFDIRYPDRFQVRGVPGELVTPPMYTKLLSLILAAGTGASDAYIQNYLNENTSTSSTFTTVPQIDPNTGQVTNTLQQTQGQPVNSQIGASIALGAAQSGAEELAAMLQKDLDKYQPYVKIQKGYPLFVQLESTVNIAERQSNGFAIKAEEEANSKAKGDQTARSGDPDTYPPGDARYRYDGRAATPSVLNPINGQMGGTGRMDPMGGMTPERIAESQIATYEAMQDPGVQAYRDQQRQDANQNVVDLIRQIEQSRGNNPNGN